MTRNYTVKMTPKDGGVSFYPAAPARGAGDHTTNKARAQRMTVQQAEDFAARVALLVASLTATVERMDS